jgi:hypothetical protein
MILYEKNELISDTNAYAKFQINNERAKFHGFQFKRQSSKSLCFLIFNFPKKKHLFSF